MPDDDIAERLRAVERAVTDGDTPVRDLSDAAAVHERLDAVEADLETVAERVDALEATVQSLHGYVGELEAVNDRVERRADAARAAVERLEDERGLGGSAHGGRADTDSGSVGGNSENCDGRNGTADGNYGTADGGAVHGPGRHGGPGDCSDDHLSASARNSDRDSSEDESLFGDRDEENGDSLFDRVRESL